MLHDLFVWHVDVMFEEEDATYFIQQILCPIQQDDNLDQKIEISQIFLQTLQKEMQRLLEKDPEYRLKSLTQNMFSIKEIKIDGYFLLEKKAQELYQLVRNGKTKGELKKQYPHFSHFIGSLFKKLENINEW